MKIVCSGCGRRHFPGIIDLESGEVIQCVCGGVLDVDYQPAPDPIIKNVKRVSDLDVLGMVAAIVTRRGRN